MREEILRMERVTYRERGVDRLENFSMTIRAGEIMGLVPVNYYGLSALAKLLRQNLPLHYGYVYYREKPVNNWRHSSMSTNRISIIRNKSCLADGLTVADNIFVLRPGFKQHIIRPGMLQKQLEPFLQDIDMQIRADELIENLSAFERFVVELLKAVVAGHRLVVLEYISTFISDAELEKLHRILRHYAGQGMAFLYITAHCEEAEQICDRSALMMNGQITKIFDRGEKMPGLITLQDVQYFDRYVRQQLAGRMNLKQTGPPVLEVKELNLGRPEPISFSIAAGECLVLQDLHSGMIQELLDIITGGARAQSGHILVGGRPYGRRIQRELAVIQETPVRTMLFGNMSCFENLCFTLDHRIHHMWGSGRMQKSMRREYAKLFDENILERRMDTLTLEQEYDVIYTRILLQKPRVVFCVQPFKGADVSLRAHIVKLLERFLQRGIGVVILAVNLADSLALADRLIRVSESGHTQEYERGNFGELPAATPWRYLYRETQ